MNSSYVMVLIPRLKSGEVYFHDPKLQARWDASCLCVCDRTLPEVGARRVQCDRVIMYINSELGYMFRYLFYASIPNSNTWPSKCRAEVDLYLVSTTVQVNEYGTVCSNLVWLTSSRSGTRLERKERRALPVKGNVAYVG